MYLTSFYMTNLHNPRLYQLERQRRLIRFNNPSIDPDTGERIRRLTPVENYQMQQPSSWAVRF